MSLRKSRAIFLTLLLPLAWATAASAQQVGVTSAASGDPRGTPPAQPARTLRVGIDVFGSERVTTGPADRAHLVFLDGSGLTVGANSELTIDKFVFDANRNAGELAVNATKGAFRFVGGAISKKGEVIIRTPSAHIGVRGGIATVTVGADGSTTATFLFGDRLTVSNAAGTQRAVRYGSQIFVPAGGAAPLQHVAGLSRPVRADPDDGQCHRPRRQGADRFGPADAQRECTALCRSLVETGAVAGLPATRRHAGRHDQQRGASARFCAQPTERVYRYPRWRWRRRRRRWPRRRERLGTASGEGSCGLVLRPADRERVP